MVEIILEPGQELSPALFCMGVVIAGQGAEQCAFVDRGEQVTAQGCVACRGGVVAGGTPGDPVQEECEVLAAQDLFGAEVGRRWAHGARRAH